MNGAYETIVVQTPRESVTLVTLNRPDALNAYTPLMCEELVEAFSEYGKSDDQRCLVLTGAGRGFCSGGDIRALEGYRIARSRQFGHAVNMRESNHRLVLTATRLDKPIVGAINGPAVAGGLALAMLCDIRIAAESAILGDTASTSGLLPDEGGTWFFPRAMGMDRALQMMWLSETYSAREAKSLGLVTHVVADNELHSSALGLAEKIASRAPLATRLTKLMARRARGFTLEDALGDAEFGATVINESLDAKEGIEAFREKRPPRFVGR